MTNRLLIVSSLNTVSPANYLIDAFLSVGCEVLAISDVPSSRAAFLVKGAFDVDKFAEEHDFKPDLLLFIEGGEMGIFPINFSSLKCPKAWWAIDSHNDYQKHVHISRLFDFTFVAQESYIKKFNRDGITQTSWLPLAHSNSDYDLEEKTFDVSYVGSTDWKRYPERKELLDAVKDNFTNIFVGPCSPSEMYSVYRRSKIVFNYSPMNDLNMRFFEALGSGAVLFTNKIINNGVERLFTKNVHYVEYETAQDMVIKMKNLLSNSVELQKIIEMGSNIAAKNHTYVNRAREILNTSIEQNQKSISRADYAVALLSLGLVSCSVHQFYQAITNTTGRRNSLIKVLLFPFFQLAITISEIIELIAHRFRRRSW